jgi:hypothetical protein
MLSNLSAADWENCNVQVFVPVPFGPDEPDLFMPMLFESDPLLSAADASPNDLGTSGSPI